MPVQSSDTIIGPNRGTPEQWITWVENNSVDRPDDVKKLITEIYRLCAPDDMPDAAIVTAQAFEETGNFTNRWWRERLNAGSLGVTGDPAQDEQSPSFPTAQLAARGIVAHDLLYATGQIDRHGFRSIDDPRYSAYREAYGQQSYPRLADLSGRYARDVHYAEHIADRAATINPGLPDQKGAPVTQKIVYGRVPKPPIEVMICKKAGDGHGYNEVGPRQIVGGCRHITDGNGTIEFYHSFFSQGGERADDALVDFIIDRDGRIAMFNDPFGTRAPWANGGSDGLEGDGIAFYNKLGASGINSRLFSVEHIGTAPNALTPAQLKASIWLWAWMFDQIHVPYTSYPVNPNIGLRTDLEHWEFATKPCPGAGVRGQVDDHQEGVIAKLKEFQLVDDSAPVEAPPQPPASLYPPGMTEELAKRLYGQLKVSWASVPFTFSPDRSECRFWLNRGMSQLKPGEDYTKATWPEINDCIRRGNGNRVFTWEGGVSYEQAARSV